MAFFTADWVNQLIREEHATLQKYMSDKGHDFRKYIDSTLPFSLYLDINNIRKEILTPNSEFIQQLSSILKSDDPQLIITELETAYKKVINLYIDTFPHVSSNELENKLNSLALGIEAGGIKGVLDTQFKGTFVVSNISKSNKVVLVIFPRFNTISSRFDNDFRSVFNYSAFSDTMDLDTGNSPRKLVTAFLKGNFGLLQNLGHVEVDILSTKAGSSEVKRGLVSPRLLQALVSLPNSINPSNLVRKFSKETGQAETRIIIRKKFSEHKLVLEMLIESGIMIGTPESRKTNLDKAVKERAFAIGVGLTRKLVSDPKLLLFLVTSKSISHYITSSVIETIKGIKPSKYTSTTTLRKTTPIAYSKVKVSAKKPSPQSSLPQIKNNQGQFYSLASLQQLINDNLQHVISANMGSGNQQDILNYQTGRFASSAKIERMSQSREGMITAFYTYMKNPYQTFEPGFAQGSPKTRDPKLLIAKSIREIAATKVGNRMRAVLV